MLSGPILLFHPYLNLSGYSRTLPTPLNAQRRNEFYSKTQYGTKIREDISQQSFLHFQIVSGVAADSIAFYSSASEEQPQLRYWPSSLAYEIS